MPKLWRPVLPIPRLEDQQAMAFSRLRHSSTGAQSQQQVQRETGALKQSEPGLKCCLSPLAWVGMDFRQTYPLGLLSDDIPGTLTFGSLGSSVGTQESTGVISYQGLADAHIHFLQRKEEKKKERSSGRIITRSSRYWLHLYLHLELWERTVLSPALCNWYHKFLHP